MDPQLRSPAVNSVQLLISNSLSVLLLILIKLCGNELRRCHLSGREDIFIDINIYAISAFKLIVNSY